MTFKIYTNQTTWDTKQTEYHDWMKANVPRYRADQWAKKEWSKHPKDNKWKLGIPEGYPDSGVELTKDWILKDG